jgi:hypothetical protein
MSAANPTHLREVNDLILEQILVFKQPTRITDPQLLEYYLRHLRLMALYREQDRARTSQGRSQESSN